MNEVLAADDQELVEVLTADRPDPALGDGVGIGRANRCEDDLDTGRAGQLPGDRACVGTPSRAITSASACAMPSSRLVRLAA
jgi:hypothetical protein